MYHYYCRYCTTRFVTKWLEDCVPHFVDSVKRVLMKVCDFRSVWAITTELISISLCAQALFFWWISLIKLSINGFMNSALTVSIAQLSQIIRKLFKTSCGIFVFKIVTAVYIYICLTDWSKRVAELFTINSQLDNRSHVTD